MLQVTKNFEVVYPYLNEGLIQAMELAGLYYTQAPCPVLHHFGPGIYIREVHMPKGMLAIGNMHSGSHMNAFLKGKIILHKESGVTEMSAPVLLHTLGGRKIAYVEEDSVWANIYSTDCRDVLQIEQETCSSSNVYKLARKVRIDALRKFMEEDRVDFESLNLNTEYIAECIGKSITLSDGTYKFQPAESAIHGIGLFASANIVENEIICKLYGDGGTVDVLRYLNHSKNPTCKLYYENAHECFLQANKDLHGYHGGFVGQELTIDYRKLYGGKR